MGIDFSHMDILFFGAAAIIFGYAAGRLVRYLKLPGVVGYLIAGLIFGPSFLNMFQHEVIDKLSIFTDVALSLVAFIIGSQMRFGTLRQLGSGIGIVTVLEALGAFLLVALGIYVLTGQVYTALLFGAIAPASAPAGAVAVMEEYKAKGRLTNAIYAVVGLDDGLAIVIFAVAAGLAKLSLTGEAGGVYNALGRAAIEIFGSIGLGCIFGYLMGLLIENIPAEEGILPVSIAGIFACTGLAKYFDFSLILANLSLGMVFVNTFFASNRKSHRSIESISLPIYIIFFFIAGAKLEIGLLPSMGLVGLVYVICRIAGLVGGAYVGSTLTRQSSVIRKYLGLGILSQAGVAIGLAVLSASRFEDLGPQGKAVSILIVNIIAASTILFEIIGPIGVKFGISRAGEVGVNITEEDLIKTYRVKDVMDPQVPAISAGMSLSEVIRTVSDTDHSFYPVVDNERKLIGALTLDGIRKTFTTQELNEWLVALDIVEPVAGRLRPDIPLSEAFEKARHLDVENLPVVNSEEDGTLAGVFECRAVRRSLSAEVLSRQQKADIIADG